MLSSHNDNSSGISNSSNETGGTSYTSYNGIDKEPVKELVVEQSPRLTSRLPIWIWLLAIFIVGTATLVVLTSSVLLSPHPPRAGTTDTAAMELRVGSQAPDFDLTDVGTGQSVKLSALRGRPVWINFWATWCPSCKTELPRMQAKYSKYKDQGLVVVGVDEREDPGQVRDYIRENKYGWTFVVDQDGAVTNRYLVGGIPEHVFVGADGIVRVIQIGELSDESMEEALAKILHRLAR